MRHALILLAMGGSVVMLSACASSQGCETDADTSPPPPRDSTPEPDQENLRNVLRERPD